jgi:hypothetical protein
MESLTKILLKNGVRGMLSENESYFKENIVQTLSFKLNASIQEATLALSENLLVSESTTPETQSLKNFVIFLESFKPGKFKFKDDSIINITESDIESIKKLFEGLNTKNRLQLTKDIFKNPTEFKQHIEFSKSAKGLL